MVLQPGQLLDVTVLQKTCRAVRGGGEIGCRHAQRDVERWSVVPPEVVMKLGFEQNERVTERDQCVFEMYVNLLRALKKKSAKAGSLGFWLGVYLATNECENIDVFFGSWLPSWVKTRWKILQASHER